MTDSVQHQGPDQLCPSTFHVAWLPDQAVKLRADDEEIASDPPVSVVTTFKKVALKYPDRIAMVDSYNDVDDIYTYKRYYESVTHVAKAFIKLGLKSYHGVGIIGFNAPQWFISYLGAIFAGGVTVGLAHTISAISRIADTTNCNIIIVEDDKLLQSILKIAYRLPCLKAIIQYRGQPKDGFKNVFSWKEIMEMNVDDCDEEFERRIKNMAPNMCCTVVSTSGTTGNPKLVMLSHDNIVWNLKSLLNFLKEKDEILPFTIVSYQTLCHVSALLLDIYVPIVSNGGSVNFAKRDALNERTLTETLRRVRPTFFAGVPKVFEMIMNSFLDSKAGKNAINKLFLSWAKRNRGKCIKNSKLKILILKRMAAHMGLDRCRFALVGATPCNQEVLDFFLALGIPLLECYGMSEGGCNATNLRSCFKVNSVGQMLPGIQLKLQQIFDRNEMEVCLRGRNVFMGYLGDEQHSRSVFDENMWFHTSDLGMSDENRILTLCGRLNDYMVLHYQKVFPAPIEKRILDQMSCLSYCVVVNEGRDFLNVLLVLKTKFDPESGEPTDFLDQAALDWCRNLGVNAEKLSEIVETKDARIAEEIQKVIDETNDRATRDTEMVHKWKIVSRNFSVTGGELTPSMKPKRSMINQLYKKEISEFYLENSQTS